MLLRKTSIYFLIALSLTVASFLSFEVFGQSPGDSRTVPQRTGPIQGMRTWHGDLNNYDNAPLINDQGTIDIKVVTQFKFNAKKKLTPTKNDRKAFESFLSQPNSGIFKFAAENGCAKGLDVRNPKDECLNYFLPGKGFAYSFRRNDYTHAALSDLQISNGKFVISGAYIMGMLTFLGDIPIDALTLQNENVLSLQQFSPAAKIDEIILQDTNFSKGTKVGNLVYRKSAPIQENATYLLRSVAFDAEFENRPLGEPNPFGDDKRSDVIILFRVVKKDKDGSITVLWKELSHQNSPKIAVELGK